MKGTMRSKVYLGNFKISTGNQLQHTSHQPMQELSPNKILRSADELNSERLLHFTIIILSWQCSKTSF